MQFPPFYTRLINNLWVWSKNPSSVDFAKSYEVNPLVISKLQNTGRVDFRKSTFLYWTHLLVRVSLKLKPLLVVCRPLLFFFHAFNFGLQLLYLCLLYFYGFYQKWYKIVVAVLYSASIAYRNQFWKSVYNRYRIEFYLCFIPSKFGLETKKYFNIKLFLNWNFDNKLPNN